MTGSERLSVFSRKLGWNFFLIFKINIIDWINIHRVKGSNCKNINWEWKIFHSNCSSEKHFEKKKGREKNQHFFIRYVTDTLFIGNVDMSIVRIFTVKLNNRGTFPRDRKQRRQMNPRGGRQATNPPPLPPFTMLFKPAVVNSRPSQMAPLFYSYRSTFLCSWIKIQAALTESFRWNRVEQLWLVAGCWCTKQWEKAIIESVGKFLETELGGR